MTDFSQENKDNLVAKLVSTQTFEKGLELQERLHHEKIKDGQALRWSRKVLQIILLILLTFEILFLAYLILSQGIQQLLFTHLPFHLDEWTFGFFINGALIQTCILIRPIAKDLFSGHKNGVGSS